MLANNYEYILSCDIGGTHITSSIIFKPTWQILEDTVTRSPINSSQSAKSIFQSWADNISTCQEKFSRDINCIGIAMPGPFDYENGISLMKDQSKYDTLYQLSTTEGLQDALHNRSIEIRYINDAAAFLQGEVYAVGREEESCILGITLGTGLGSAVKKNSIKAFDADLWNTPYQDSIFEEFLVTRWFTQRFYELSGKKENGLKEIIQHHQNAEAFDQLIAEYRIHLKNFMDYFSDKYGSNSYILGGNITKAWAIIDDNKTFSSFNITIGKYAEKAALIGAASIF